MSGTLADKIVYEGDTLSMSCYGGEPSEVSPVDAVEIHGEAVNTLRHEEGALFASLEMAAPVALEDRGPEVVAVVGGRKD